MAIGFILRCSRIHWKAYSLCPTCATSFIYCNAVYDTFTDILQQQALKHNFSLITLDLKKQTKYDTVLHSFLFLLGLSVTKTEYDTIPFFLSCWC